MTAPTPCIACRNFTFQWLKEGEKASAGRGCCRQLTRDVSVHIEKATLCRHFAALPEIEAEARRVWWLSQKRDKQNN